MRADGTIAWVDGPGMHVIDGAPLVALSCTFIPARLSDNRFLRDTDYRAQLMSLPEPLRSKLLHGDFLAGREDAREPGDPARPGSRRRRSAGSRTAASGVKMTHARRRRRAGRRRRDRAGARCTAPGSRRWSSAAASTPANGPAVAALVVEHDARRRAGQHRPHRRLGRLGARPSGGAGHPGRAGGVLARLARAHEGRTAHLRQQALGAVVEVPRGARPGAAATASRCRRTGGSPRSSPRRPGGCAATRS